MPTETGCNPPNCLQIPRANCFSVVGYSQRPNCGGLVYDFPFDPALGPASVGPFSFAPFLCHVFWGFRLADGSCQQVQVVNPSPTGTPVVGQSTVQCPPGFTYDIVHEACVLNGVLVIWPNGGGGPCVCVTGTEACCSPPPPPPPPPPAGCDPLLNPEACCPPPSKPSTPCLLTCEATGVLSLGQCLQACCVPPDPPVPRARRDVVSRRVRSQFDFGKAPFELQRVRQIEAIGQRLERQTEALSQPSKSGAVETAKLLSANFRLLNPSFRGHKPLAGG